MSILVLLFIIIFKKYPKLVFIYIFNISNYYFYLYIQYIKLLFLFYK